MLSCCKCSGLSVTRRCSRREPPAGCWLRDHFDARMLFTAVKRTKYNRLKVVLTLKRHHLERLRGGGDGRRFRLLGRGWRQRFSLYLPDVGNWRTTYCLKYWDGSACVSSCCILQARRMRRRRLRHDTVCVGSCPLSQFCKHLLWLCYLNE